MRQLLPLLLIAALAGCAGAPEAVLPLVGAPASGGAHPNGDLLADPGSLAAKLEAAGETGIAEDLLVVDARPRADYDRGHLPAAISLPWDELTDEDGLPLPNNVISDKLGLLGALPTQFIVIYDDGPADPAAERLFWLMEHLGAGNLQVLSGGFVAWTAAERPTTTELPRRPPTTFAVSLRERVAADDGRLEAAVAGAEVVVDARADSSYLGWDGVAAGAEDSPGGHIPGAIHFPATWTYDQQGLRAADTLKTQIDAKLPRDKPLVIYSDRAGRAAQVYFALRVCDVPQVALYPGGLRRWARDRSRKQALVKQPRHDRIVHPEWLRGVRSGLALPHPPIGARTLVVHVGYGGPETSYDQGHIPGAIYLDTNAIEADEQLSPRNWWNLLPDEKLQAALLAHGITRNTTVVCYGKGNMAAARLAWALMYAGVEDVRLLNGGLQAWTETGGEASTTATAPEPASDFGGAVPGKPALRVTTEQVRDLLKAGKPVVDIRSWPEHVGESTGYDYIETRGRITGSVWGHGGPNANSVADFEDAIDGTLRSPTEVAALWKGIDASGGVTFYCGTGWRASVAFCYAYALGWNPSVYDGGWMEWSMGPLNARNAMERGIPEKR